MAKLNEIEVFRLTPEKDKYYQTTTYTHIIGQFPNQKYYTTNNLRYVGNFIRHESCGYHDNSIHWDIFDNNGIEEIVKYTYEGTTCFIEVQPKISINLKEELFQKINNNMIPSLKDLVKQQLTTEETRITREIELL
jgi:hypothetical protein